MTRHPVGDFKRVADDGFFVDFSSIWVDLGDLTKWVLVNGRYPKPGGYKGTKYQMGLMGLTNTRYPNSERILDGYFDMSIFLRFQCGYLYLSCFAI